MKFIYILRFTYDDGETWSPQYGEFFTGYEAAKRKVELLNNGVNGELCRYDVFTIARSCSDISD